MDTPETFRRSYCARHRCTDSTFDGAVFWQGLYRHAVPLALVIRRVAPGFFRDDEEFIRFVGDDASMAEIEEDVERFAYGNRVRRHWLRTGLRIQVDPSRIAALAKECLKT